MTLAVVCNNATKQYFNDLASAEPCVTPEKLKVLQDRLQEAVKRRDAELNKLRQLLIDGKITADVYNLLKKEIDGRSSEDLHVVKQPLSISANVAKIGPQGRPYTSGFSGIGSVEDLASTFSKG